MTRLGWLVPLLLSTVPVVATTASALAEEATAAAGQPIIERDTVEIAPHESVKIDTVSIENRLGDVRIVGHDGPGISLTVVKRAPDEETLNRLKVNLLPDPSGKVKIGTAILFGDEARPIAAGSVRIDITVSMPRTAHVDARAWNGKLQLAGVRSGASLAAHAGDIDVTDVRGTVSTMSGSGRQRLVSVDGDVNADGARGSLELDEIRGDSLVAHLHDGTVTAERIRSRRVQIRTTFGRILFQGELIPSGTYDLRSYKGDVEVRFAKAAAFRLDVYARDGKIDSRVELADAARPETSRLLGTYGPTRAKPAVLEMSSMGGNVVLGLMNE